MTVIDLDLSFSRSLCIFADTILLFEALAAQSDSSLAVVRLPQLVLLCMSFAVADDDHTS